MGVVDLLNEAKKSGVKIEVVDGELQIEAKASKKHWLDKLRPHKQEILSFLIGEPTAEEIGEPPIQAEQYKPFPIHTLPKPVAKYVNAAAKSIGCDSSFIALPVLASLARAIGNRRVIRLKRTWTEPAIIWGAMIGKSGTHKTPAMQAAMMFLDRRQSESVAEHERAIETYDQDHAQYAMDFRAWQKSGKDKGLPPVEPALPTCLRYVTSDCTIEALAALLHDQFDGLLVSRDELAGWLNGIAEYKGGQGSDLGHWLAMWSAAPLTVDRKTGAIKMIHIPRASVSLVGGIQPGTLQKAIGREHMQDGLCARLLFAMPPAKPVVWTEAVVDEKTEQAMGGLIDRLLELEPLTTEGGDPEPVPLDLTCRAKKVWVEFFNRHRAELADLDDDLAACWSKLEAYAARFALIFQLCDCPHDHSIDETAMKSAIGLADWFGHEAKRVYGMFVEDDKGQEQRELTDWIERRGGRTTARDLQSSMRTYRQAGKAEAALCRLASEHLGGWSVVKTSGRPRREFVLTAVSASAEAPETAETATSVDADNADAPQNGQVWEASL